MHLWAKGFGRFGNEAENDGNRGFDYRIAGTALGGDMAVANGLRIGVSAAYANTEETVAHHAADADINTTQAAVYADYQKGPYFITGTLSGGWQHLDLNRQIGADTTITFPDESFDPGSGRVEANATTHGWLFGSSMQVGAQFAFPKGWRLTPSVAVAYQHQWVSGYSEHGGGSARVAINSHQADAVRLKAQLVLAQDYEWTGYTITPHAKVGVQQQYNFGGNASGSFSDSAGFNLALTESNRTIGLAGIGVDLTFQNGLSTYVDYDGALASGRTVQSVTGGLRYSW
jgi:outer membrane autotransporter protein